MSHIITRILLAMYLAIWSPALCCCGVKAAMGAVTGVDVAACGHSSAQPTETEAETESDGDCCAHRESDAVEPAPASCHAPESSTSGDDPLPCRCHETVESKVRIDTGAKVSLPALVKIDTLPAMLPAVFTSTLVPSVAEGACVAGHRSHAPPGPLTTLFAQHCLLLT